MKEHKQESNSAIRSKQVLNVKSLKWTSENIQYNVVQHNNKCNKL